MRTLAISSILSLVVAAGSVLGQPGISTYGYPPAYSPAAREVVVPVTRETIVPASHGTFIPASRDTIVPVNRGTVVPMTRETIIPVSRGTVVPLTRETIVPVTQEKLVPVANPTVAPAMETGIATEPICLDEACMEACKRNVLRAEAEYLMWWVKKGPVTAPLLTTTTEDPPNILTYGGLADEFTVLLFGQTHMDYGMFSGIRGAAAVALTDRLDIEARGFFLFQKTFRHEVFGDPVGNPPLFEPQINMEPNFGTPVDPAFGSVNAGFPTSFPGVFGDGVFTAHSSSMFWGAELNGVVHLDRDSPWRVSVIAGARLLALDENLDVLEGTSNVTSDPNAGFFYLGGIFSNQGSRHEELDSWKTFNRFYGGQIGANVERQFGRLSLAAGAKFALGASVQQLHITGFSTAIPVGNDITEPGQGINSTIIPFVPDVDFGGVLTNPASIGEFERSAIATVSELNFQAGLDVTSYFRLLVGYTLVYWSNVIRPGEQIDSLVNQSWLPSGIGFDNLFRGQAWPRVPYTRGDFWAHGLSVGLDLRY